MFSARLEGGFRTDIIILNVMAVFVYLSQEPPSQVLLCFTMAEQRAATKPGEGFLTMNVPVRR